MNALEEYINKQPSDQPSDRLNRNLNFVSRYSCVEFILFVVFMLLFILIRTFLPCCIVLEFVCCLARQIDGTAAAAAVDDDDDGDGANVVCCVCSKCFFFGFLFREH